MDKQKGSAVQISPYIDLFLRANETKNILRKGWVREKINKPESVAEHLFSLSFITMQLAPLIAERLDYPLNISKLIKMAILHDFGEIETGDIVVARGSKIDLMKREEKEKKERQAIKKIFEKTDTSNEMFMYFDELLERKTIEAKILWQLDTLDIAMQALSYESEQEKNLDEFFEYAKANITDKLLTQLLEEILQRRKKT
jgi:putative hydrolase of HD superfamily